MALTQDEVKHVALLARLELSPEELDKFTRQLDSILNFAGMLDELNLSDVPPTSHVVPLKNVFRDDAVGDSLPVADALANAPDPLGDFFRVPKVIEEE